MALEKELAVGTATGEPRRIGRVLRRRRHLRAGALQLIYAVVAVALGLVSPRIGVWFSVPGPGAGEMLIGIAFAMLTFIGIVYSLLFLVIQLASTTLTPRLTVFRDAPIVAHGFAQFSAIIAYSLTAALTIAGDKEVSGMVPIIACVGMVGSIWIYRALQTRAFKAIQFSTVLDDVAKRGREVIDGLYLDQVGATAHRAQSERDARPVAPGAQVHELRWPNRAGVIQVIDVPRVISLAEGAGGLVRFGVGAGESIQEHGVVATVSGSAEFSKRELVGAIVVGEERTFAQDPSFALRVLVDIALRALSPAINDPTTAIEALDRIESLLGSLASAISTSGTSRGATGPCASCSFSRPGTTTSASRWTSWLRCRASRSWCGVAPSG